MVIRGYGTRRHFLILLSLFLSSCSTDALWLVDVQNEQRPWAVHGDVVNERGAEEGWVVFHRGVIVYVGSDTSKVPPNARRIQHNGFIFPGLIDTHNHA